MNDVVPDRFDREAHIVTGAGSGFGRACALRFSAEGAAVVCADINGAAAEETADLIRRSGGRSIGVATDVSSVESTRAMAAVSLDTYGRIDGLFANAGVSGAGAAHLLELEDWQRALAVNLTGSMLSARAVVPAMIEAGRGSILFTASISGSRGFPNQAAYAATKGGILALSRQMAVDLAGHRIRVNCVSPGLVRTGVVEGLYRRREVETGTPWETALSDMQSRYPLGGGQLEDIAAAVSFLQSSEARWITGHDLRVDGGFTA